jgi:hypothetical protein
VLPGQGCVRTQGVAFGCISACVRCFGARTTASASQHCVRSCVGAGFDRKCVRTPYVRSNAFERPMCDRTRITAHGARLKRCTIGPARATREMRADWTCVRAWSLRWTAVAFERTKCDRTHFQGLNSFFASFLPFETHFAPKTYNTLKY